MHKLRSTIFATTTLAATAGVSIAAPQADLAFDRNRMFFRYVAPGVDSGDFQVLPENRHDPIVLPCDVQSFGGQADFAYLGAGPTVFPRFAEAFFIDQTNQPITSNGCGGPLTLTEESGGFNAMTAGSVQSDGYTTVSSTSPFCPWLFQPSDLPADTVVRIHLSITPYPDATLQGNPIADPDLSNNAHDIYVRRSCSCQ